MGELVDPADLKSAAVRRTGSTPVTRTNYNILYPSLTL